MRLGFIQLEIGESFSIIEQLVILLLGHLRNLAKSMKNTNNPKNR